MATGTIGRYEVENVIGRGAMAVVYRAVDPTIGRTLALKTMRFDVHGIEKNEVISRFRNEARAAGKLLHPNLVTIYDAGEQEGTFYIAMECVEGQTLQAMLSEQRWLTLDRAVDILSQICAGLDYAHANGVVHRDIKPANLMITRSGVVKIMDFGIAKTGAQLSTGGDILGTPNYISPEMVKGESVDGRSDLFSAAVILHEMLLGERPFTAPNISTIIYKIVNEPVPPELETKVHPAVAAILRKALSKHPSDRYQTGADLAGALKSYQAMLTQPIPSSVIPGTPILTNFPVVSSGGAGAAAAPKLAEVPANPVTSASPVFDAPPVFGSDVPAEFLGISAPVVPVDYVEPSSSDPAAKWPLPPPADPVPSTFGAFSAPPVPPAVPIAKKAPSGPLPGPLGSSRSLGRILLVAAGTLLAIGAVLLGYKGISTHNAQKAVTSVPAADPLVIPATLNVKSPDKVSKGESDTADSEPPAEPSTAVTNKKKYLRSEAILSGTATEPVVAAPVVTTADLSITTKPAGASVQLDGENRSEKTPFTAAGVNAGTHTLIFTKPGYAPLTRTVDVVAGNEASISVDLAVVPTAIAFESTPAGAAITVDEEPTGQVTPATVKLSAGAHTISIVKEGFDEGTGTVQLIRGETHHFSVVLQPSNRDAHIRNMFAGARDRGMIVVRSRPRGAHIRLDDNNKVDAVTPARIIVRKGKIHLVVEEEGYKTYRRDVQVDKGDVVVVDAVLEPKS